MGSQDPEADRHSLMETSKWSWQLGRRATMTLTSESSRAIRADVVYDVDTLQILDANDAALAVYGYSYADFTCLSIRDIRPVEDVPKLLELARDLPHFDRTGPWRHRKANGTIIQLLIDTHAFSFGPHKARLVIVEDPDTAPL